MTQRFWDWTPNAERLRENERKLTEVGVAEVQRAVLWLMQSNNAVERFGQVAVLATTIKAAADWLRNSDSYRGLRLDKSVLRRALLVWESRGCLQILNRPTRLVVHWGLVSDWLAARQECADVSQLVWRENVVTAEPAPKFVTVGDRRGPSVTVGDRRGPSVTVGDRRGPSVTVGDRSVSDRVSDRVSDKDLSLNKGKKFTHSLTHSVPEPRSQPVTAGHSRSQPVPAGDADGPRSVCGAVRLPQIPPDVFDVERTPAALYAALKRWWDEGRVAELGHAADHVVGAILAARGKTNPQRYAEACLAGGVKSHWIDAAQRLRRSQQPRPYVALGLSE